MSVIELYPYRYVHRDTQVLLYANESFWNNCPDKYTQCADKIFLEHCRALIARVSFFFQIQKSPLQILICDGE